MNIRVPYLFARTRRLIDIAPERPLSPTENMPPPKGMRAAYLASLLDESHRPALHLLDHSEGFDFGTHHRWERGEMVYTVAGLRWIADRFDEMVSPAAALIVRSAANELEASIKAAAACSPTQFKEPTEIITRRPWLNDWENSRS